jgi:sugar phosphate permease
MPSAPRPAQTLKSARSLFAEKDYWIISLGTFCRYGIFAAVQALWAGPFLMTVIEVSPVTAGNLLLLMSVGVIGGSPFWGWASDTGLNARKPVVIGGLAGMLIILSLFCLLSPGAGRPLLVALFFGFGFFSSAGQVMYPHIKERMPIEHAGMAMTGINFFTMTGVAVFLQGLGSLMERIYPAASLGPEAFRTAFLFCCGCLAATAAIYLMTRETRGAKKLTPKGR